jgi:hypothetical protein
MTNKSLYLLVLFFLPSLGYGQTSVQSNYPESLRGLNGVRVVVLFGRAEALDESKRPALLQILQNDAEEKLTKAVIRLLKKPGEVQSTPGSPELIIMVTLDKPNGHVFPVVTETRLLQKARLAQRPEVELSLATWVTKSIGDYELSDLYNMRLQVGNEIQQFIKDYLAANSTARR